MALAKRLASPYERASHRWGLESWLDCWGWIFLAVGILVTSFMYFVGVNTAFTALRVHDSYIMFLFVHFQLFVGIVSSIALFLVFRWLAESLRLLKKLTCLDFSGQISDSRREPATQWICSACRNPTYNNATCEHCEAKFE
ncbi:MAG: hypothetical protein JNL67_08410 [Planctomycetaceae bacterium]|nr:hypothetical protein [Planctomycetaceae bacterium]